jgi:hypothetical protein
MIPRSIFVAQPAVAFSVLLDTCNEILDHSVTAGIDATARQFSDAERFLSILAAMREQDAPASLAPNLLTQVSFSVLTVSDGADMMDILEACSGMAFTHAETKLRSILVAVITGTVQQWRDSIVTGTQHLQPTIRHGFNQLHDLFVQAGLGTVWNDYEQKIHDDNSYTLIEYKPHG